MSLVGDIVRVIAKGSYLSQNIVNVFFYRVFDTSETTSQIGGWGDEWATQFETNVLPSLRTDLVYDELVIENLTDGISYREFSVNVTGANAGQRMPSLMAMNVKLSRTTKVTRNGSKRFSGLVEENVTNNQLVLTQTEVDDLEQWLGSLVTISNYDTSGSFISLEPVIVGRTKNIDGTYVLDLSKINKVSGADLRLDVTTQRTRKP